MQLVVNIEKNHTEMTHHVTYLSAECIISVQHKTDEIIMSSTYNRSSII